MKVSIVWGLTFVLHCQAVTYYLDASCASKFAGIWDEIHGMAKAGNAALADGKNDVMAAAFKQLFKVDKTDTNAVTKVTNAFTAVDKMTLTDDFKTADARIYCDNDDAGPDKRWQPYPDLEGAGKKSKNSKKKFEEQMWWDHTNHIFRALGARGCQELGSGTQGQTYKPKDTPDTSGLNSVREIITICDVALNQKIRLLSDIDKKKDLTKQVDMVTMEDFVSLTLFHELLHLTKVAGLPPRPDPFGWEDALATSASNALLSPDCYTFLAFSAHLNEYNVRIAKDDKKAKEGELEFITPPKADGGGGKKKRTFGLRSRKRGITYAPVQKGPAIVDERGGILFTA